tara:strand:+ start:385 stop:525 length:141 start_codon:yes stop_codon:yes gene_type:complete
MGLETVTVRKAKMRMTALRGVLEEFDSAATMRSVCDEVREQLRKFD